MNIVQDMRRADSFHENELVMWHFHEGNTQIPIPAVVVQQAEDSVVIRARIQGMVKELQVDAEQLFHR